MPSPHPETSPAQESVLRRHPRAEDRQSPADLGAAGWKATLRRTKERIKSDRVTMASGSLAYHWFLAFFPAVIAALGLLTLLRIGPSTLHHLTHGIAKALPSGSAGVFDAAVKAAGTRSTGSAAAVVVGVVVALWSASSGMAVLEQALDLAYQVPSDRSFLSRRLLAVPLMGVVAVIGGGAGALVVFGQPIGSAIEGAVPLHGEAFSVVWTVVRWVVALLLLTMLFSAIYYLAPNRRSPRWQWVSAGGLLATAVFMVASLAFSFYVSSFGSYSKTYGSFAGVAILIFWMWLIGFAVLVGGEVNAEVERETAERALGSAQPVTVDAPERRSAV
ncbi:MAG: YihY/virulence factor BrkB family protein [Acidimicrobiales bacterium]